MKSLWYLPVLKFRSAEVPAGFPCKTRGELMNSKTGKLWQNFDFFPLRTMKLIVKFKPKTLGFKKHPAFSFLPSCARIKSPVRRQFNTDRVGAGPRIRIRRSSPEGVEQFSRVYLLFHKPKVRFKLFFFLSWDWIPRRLWQPPTPQSPSAKAKARRSGPWLISAGGG